MKTVSKELKARIIAKTAGRTVVAREMGITENEARKLVDQIRSAPVETKAVVAPKAVDPRMEARVGSLPTAAADRDAKIIDLYKTTTKTMEEIGVEVGCSRSTVGDVLKRAGVPKRGTKTVTKVAKVAEVEEELKWVMGPTFINIYADGQTFTAGKDHPRFKEAADLCMAGKVRDALNIINVAKAVASYLKGDIKIEGEVVSYKGMVLDLGVAKRIIDAMNTGKPFEHMVNFLEKLMQNPSYRAVQELFGFLQHNDIELHEDGDFLAFKRVDSKYMDFYTGKMNNAPGQVVSMLRNTVNEDKDQTCSSGLHIAAKSYIPHYHGGQGRIVLCKINPQAVVSVPTDYQNAKMRVCEYTVVKDVTETFDHY